MSDFDSHIHSLYFTLNGCREREKKKFFSNKKLICLHFQSFTHFLWLAITVMHDGIIECVCVCVWKKISATLQQQQLECEENSPVNHIYSLSISYLLPSLLHFIYIIISQASRTLKSPFFSLTHMNCLLEHEQTKLT